MTANTPEPPPTPNEGTSIHDLVIADMEERKRIGIKKFGTPLQAHNGRDALVDAYQEILDTAVYLRQRIEEGCCHEPHRIFIQDKLVQIGADGIAEPVEEVECPEFVYDDGPMRMVRCVTSENDCEKCAARKLNEASGEDHD